MEVVARNSGRAHAEWFNRLTDPEDSNYDIASPRGMVTHEIIGATTVLTHPQEVVPFVRGRKLNYFGMLMESMWILSRVENLDLLKVWNSELENFADTAFRDTMYGAYGPRLFNSGTGEKGQSQIEAVLSTIEGDYDSRRAVATIYQPRDAGHPTRDLPCNTQVMFKLRDNCLNISVINRSNDLHLGLFGVNAPQFYFLGNFVARWLSTLITDRPKIYVDSQRHYSDSLHLYLGTQPQASINDRMEMHEDKVFDFYSYFHAPLRPNILPEGVNPTEEDYVGKTLNRIRYGGVTFETGSSYEATIWALLQFYAEFKRTGGRDSSILQLGSYIDEWLERSSPSDDEEVGLDSIPWDWIAGAYYTLVAWGGAEKRSDRAQVAAGEFQDLVKEHAGNMHSGLASADFAAEYEKFLVEG